MTPEELAEIARRNGAKSKGPVTSQGKRNSSRNAITYGRHTDKLKFFIPPHDACAANESRQAFYNLLDMHVEHYRPYNEVGYNVIREIAVATWQIQRLSAIQTGLINRELARLSGTPLPASDPVSQATGVTHVLFGETFIVPRLTREIDRLHRRVTQLERRYVFNRIRFSGDSKKVVKLALVEREEEREEERERENIPERTQEFSPQPITNNENEVENKKIDLAA
ncbi:MAG: hypothetical protein ACKV2U_18995 [Bryobacteraceae bacterium]